MRILVISISGTSERSTVVSRFLNANSDSTRTLLNTKENEDEEQEGWSINCSVFKLCILIMQGICLHMVKKCLILSTGSVSMSLDEDQQVAIIIRISMLHHTNVVHAFWMEEH